LAWIEGFSVPVQSKTIGIRLPPDLQTLLEDEASKRGLKPTSLAAKLVSEALTRSGTPVEAKLEQLQATLDRLERELPIRIRSAFSTGAGNPAPAAQPGFMTLHDWVNRPAEDD